MPVDDAEVPRRRENQAYKILLRTPRLCVLCVFPEHFKVGKLTLSLGKYRERTQRNHNPYSCDPAKRGLSVSTKLRYHHEWRYRGSVAPLEKRAKSALFLEHRRMAWIMHYRYLASSVVRDFHEHEYCSLCYWQ